MMDLLYQRTFSNGRMAAVVRAEISDIHVIQFDKKIEKHVL